jgi:hypothetical protein
LPFGSGGADNLTGLEGGVGSASEQPLFSKGATSDFNLSWREAIKMARCSKAFTWDKKYTIALNSSRGID